MLDKIAPFIGAILIIFGGLLAFAGAKFLFQLVAVLVAAIISAFLFFTAYNLFIPQDKVSTTLVVIVIIVCALIGLAVAFFTYKFTKAWAIPLVAAVAGGMLGLVFFKLVGVKNGYVTILGAVLGAIGGGFLGKKFNSLVRIVGTAFIGSWFIIRGIGMYAGGYPSETDVIKNGVHANTGGAFWYYFAGLIVLVIVGSAVQFRLFRDEGKDEEDAFAGEDEGRTCGCF